MALAERRDCKDYVSIFVCDDWHLLRVRRVLLSIKSQCFNKSCFLNEMLTGINHDTVFFLYVE